MNLNNSRLDDLLILKDFLTHKNYSICARRWGVSREASRGRINRMLAALGAKPGLQCDECLPELAKIIASKHGQQRGKLNARRT